MYYGRLHSCNLKRGPDGRQTKCILSDLECLHTFGHTLQFFHNMANMDSFLFMHVWISLFRHFSVVPLELNLSAKPLVRAKPNVFHTDANKRRCL